VGGFAPNRINQLNRPLRTEGEGPARGKKEGAFHTSMGKKEGKRTVLSGRRNRGRGSTSSNGMHSTKTISEKRKKYYRKRTTASTQQKTDRNRKQSTPIEKPRQGGEVLTKGSSTTFKESTRSKRFIQKEKEKRNPKPRNTELT